MTAYLLDTHLVYWWMTDAARLGRTSRKLIANEQCAVSAATLWEMVLKNARGKLPLPDTALTASLEDQGFRIVPLAASHVEACRALALEHPDPFDRVLLATACVEGLVLLTRDAGLLAAARHRALPVQPA
jgi:PIN domain nuclease of toxin-antitoxin system